MSTPTRPTPADVAAHVAASHVRRTAPLPPKATASLARLEATALPLGPSVLAAEYDAARIRAARIAAATIVQGPNKTEAVMAAVDWDGLAHAEDLMAGAKAALAEAGMLHLIGGAS